MECGFLLCRPIDRCVTSAGQAWSTLCLDLLGDKIHRGRGDWIRGLIRGSLRIFSLEPLQYRNCLVSVGVCLLVDVELNGGGVALTSGYILASTQSRRRRPRSGSRSACLSNISLARCKVCSHAIGLVCLGLEPVNHQALLGVSVDELVLTLVAISVRLDDHSREVSLVLLDGDLALVRHVGAIFPIRCKVCSHAIVVVDLDLEHVNHQVLLGVSVGELVLALVVTSVRLDDHSREVNLVLLDGSSMVLFSTV